MDGAIAYLRVSAQRQHRSGLGIEAQRAAVTRFAEAEGISILAAFIGAETGKGAEALERRPQLAAALAAAKSAKCFVTYPNSSRNVAFVAGLFGSILAKWVGDHHAHHLQERLGPWRLALVGANMGC